MSNYIKYIDDHAIERADQAFGNGEFNLSTLLYQSALFKLRKYDGDKMAAAHLAGSLSNKLDKSRENLYVTPGMDIIESKNFILSKSTYLKGKQCEKQLFLNKFKRQEASPPSFARKILFKKGRTFEDSFRKNNFPDAINIKDDLGNRFRHYASHTSNLLKSHDEITICEAGFIYNDTLVLIDVVKKNKDGTLDFYEIKNTSDLNKAILWDLAVQYYVCNQLFGDKINSFNGVFNKKFSKPSVRNLKKKVSKLEGEVRKDISKFKEVLKTQNEPDIIMGKQCDLFYPCEFKKFCSQ